MFTKISTCMRITLAVFALSCVFATAVRSEEPAKEPAPKPEAAPAQAPIPMTKETDYFKIAQLYAGAMIKYAREVYGEKKTLRWSRDFRWPRKA